MSENDGITVRQIVGHTIQLYGLDTPCCSRLPRGKAEQSILCLSQAAAIVALAHTTQQQRGPGEEYAYIILVGG